MTLLQVIGEFYSASLVPFAWNPCRDITPGYWRCSSVSELLHDVFYILPLAHWTQLFYCYFPKLGPQHILHNHRSLNKHFFIKWWVVRKLLIYSLQTWHGDNTCSSQEYCSNIFEHVGRVLNFSFLVSNCNSQTTITIVSCLSEDVICWCRPQTSRGDTCWKIFGATSLVNPLIIWFGSEKCYKSPCV